MPGRIVPQFQDQSGRTGGTGLGGVGLGGVGLGGTGLLGRPGLSGIGGTGLSGRPGLSGSGATGLSGIGRLGIACMGLAALSCMSKSFSWSDQSLPSSGRGRMGVVSWEFSHSSGV
uniref:hypothetical protein n=1 Tax=Enterocloster clostridioformis TaxID=1531 RepID=UPI0025A5964E|nr:hypothetical protein [Enterocloster clostridioformis]